MKLSKCAILGWIGLALLSATNLQAQSPPPDYSGNLLETWSFNDTTNWTDDLADLPTSWTNLAVIRGDGPAVLLDSTNGSWLVYPVQATDGSWTNLSLAQGTLMGWVYLTNSANTNGWGLDQNQWGSFVEVGAWTSNASYGWWSLWTDGTNINFSSQNNSGWQTNYFSAPLGWNPGSNTWEQFALTWTSNATQLFWNGELVTNGPGIGPLPDINVVGNFFYFGSSGLSNQLHAAFDDIWSYDYPLDATTIRGDYSVYAMVYDGAPPSSPMPMFSGAPSTPTTTNLITGSGFLQPLSTNQVCLANTNIWLTNVVASAASNGTMNVAFCVGGGNDGVLYDVFAASALGPGSITNAQFQWMGSAYHCVNYLLTNLPPSAAFLILGQPGDPDGDGLSTAFERLCSHTDPNSSDSNGDGIPDGISLIYGIDPAARVPFEVWLASPSGFSGIP